MQWCMCAPALSLDSVESILTSLLSICSNAQYFISRDLGDDFDFANYNGLITKVMTNPKYADLFAIMS